MDTSKNASLVEAVTPQQVRGDSLEKRKNSTVPLLILLGITWPGVALAVNETKMFLFWGSIIFGLVVVVGGVVTTLTKLFVEKVLKKEKPRWLFLVLAGEVLVVVALVLWNMEFIVKQLSLLLFGKI